MKSERILCVTSREFYQHLLQGAKFDLEQSTQKKVSLETIKKGFSYEKKLKNKLGKEEVVAVRSINLIEPKCYQIEIAGMQGISQMTYTIEEIDAHTIKVRYEECYMSDSKLRRANHKVMNLFYMRSGKKRVNRLLGHIEAYIAEGRGTYKVKDERGREK